LELLFAAFVLSDYNLYAILGVAGLDLCAPCSNDNDCDPQLVCVFRDDCSIQQGLSCFLDIPPANTPITLPTISPPATPPTSVISFETRYEFVSINADWDTADSYCVDNFGTALATIKTQEDANAIVNLKDYYRNELNQNVRVWIGLNDKSLSGQWSWSSGYQCDGDCTGDWWASNNPTGGKGCVYVIWGASGNNILRDYSCSFTDDRMYFACDKQNIIFSRDTAHVRYQNVIGSAIPINDIDKLHVEFEVVLTPIVAEDFNEYYQTGRIMSLSIMDDAYHLLSLSYVNLDFQQTGQWELYFPVLNDKTLTVPHCYEHGKSTLFEIEWLQSTVLFRVDGECVATKETAVSYQEFTTSFETINVGSSGFARYDEDGFDTASALMRNIVISGELKYITEVSSIQIGSSFIVAQCTNPIINNPAPECLHGSYNGVSYHYIAAGNFIHSRWDNYEYFEKFLCTEDTVDQSAIASPLYDNDIAVTCCLMDGSSGDRTCNVQPATYSEAVQICENMNGYRLCTLSELFLHRIPQGTGCSYDAAYNWVSTSCTPDVVSNAQSDPMNVDTLMVTEEPKVWWRLGTMNILIIVLLSVNVAVLLAVLISYAMGRKGKAYESVSFVSESEAED